MDLKEYHGKVFPMNSRDTFCYLFENENSDFKLSVNMFDTVK
jgi:hypothetical protein